ncbi:MAG TPA: riboflavin synthase [Acidimicrobiia bacterium]|nr:riboflavin synthase [Acidimicrobiia bacterium]
MFTGIVQALGTVAGVTRDGQDLSFVIESPLLASMEVGGSVSVNGTCLTAVSVDGNRVLVNAIAETLSRTTLGDVADGHPVNLELPMTPDSMFDGHIVQGHVDGVATVRAMVDEGDSIRVGLAADGALLRYLVEKGSVTVDGISLTVAGLDEDGFEVAIIPHTREVTTLGSKAPGDRVNVEVDVLAKYVERLLAK